jgi:hypothetical protein
MQVPILNGIYSDGAPDFRTSYPRNLMPVPKEQGISKGYLRPAEGIETFGTGPGVDRGAINWNGITYRVMGYDLVRINDDGTVTTLAVVAGSGQVTLDYSFDSLIIASGGNLYYWDTVLTQVTDPDLGTVVDALFIDGYTMTTDGTSLIVNDLNDRTSINPLKYGSAETDPDPIKRLLKLREEAHAVGRYTIEQYNNIGGNLFPFERNNGALMTRGAIGTHCACLFTMGEDEVIAFMGGGRNEPPAVWVGANSVTSKISTREIDTILQGYTETELSQALLETRCDKTHQLLYVHLPNETWVYDAAASAALQEPVWFQLTSSVVGLGQYRARNFVWCYDKWLCGDPTSTALGQLVDTVSTHYGQTIGWDFGTTILYNGGFGAILHQIELVALPGRVALGADPVVWTSFSLDGETWSQERPCSAGKQGDRLRRLTWLQNGAMQNWRIERFRGTSDAHIAFARLEIQLEPLNA